MVVLEAGPARAVLDPVGGRIASLTVAGMELLVTSGAGPLDWGLYPMVPFAGRIRHGELRVAGRVHQLPLNLPPHAIHGTLLEQTWSLDGSGVMSAELGPPWPFAGWVRHEVTLGENELRLRLVVEADELMPVTVGWHPWWRRRLARGAPLELLFGAEGMLRRDEQGIPTGEVVRPDPQDGPWDDCFVGMAGAPVMRWPGALEIDCESDCPCWVIFTQPAEALCVEPQTGPPNFANMGGSEIVEPGAPLVAEATWRWRLA